MSSRDLDASSRRSSPLAISQVYDCTKFLEDHPGGGSSITIVAGTDCTEEFEALHSSKAWKMLDEWYIGDLESDEPTGAPAPAAAPAPPPVPVAPVALNPKKWVSLQLAEREEISHDTRRLRFALQTPETELGLPTGQHMFLKATVDGKLTMRAYTPVGFGTGYVEFVIKVYFANVHPKFPAGGILTQHMNKLQIGDTLDFKGPMGEFAFDVVQPGPRVPSAMARFEHTKNKEKQTFHKLGLICGGSGITPGMQARRHLESSHPWPIPMQSRGAA